jgi:hypothetical protein
MEGWSVEEEEELNKLTNQEVPMGDTALARHQRLIERQMGNIIKNMSKEKRDELKRKLEEADDSPNNSDVMPMSPPTQVLEAQDNMEWRNPKEKKTTQFLRRQCRLIKYAKLSFKLLTEREKVEFPTHHATTKNETKLAWWWWDSFSKNTMN